jgi:Transcriptional regulator, AbiEi antitoxin
VVKKAHYLGKKDHADVRIAEIAGRQRGYVTRQQLLALGATRKTIAYRIEVGRLLPVFAGVYAVGHLSKDPVDRAFGAVLACGEKAVLSHQSAATLWGLYRQWRKPLHVTASGQRRRAGIVCHRDSLHPRDRTRQLGLPVTSPARTLIDNAPHITDKALTRGVNDLLRQGFLNRSDLVELLIRCPRHPGARLLRPFADSTTGPTRSEFEDAFQAFSERYGLPQPLINHRFHGFELDAYFPDHGVIVELDGWDFHSSRHSFESDRDRDATMLALGIVTVRITWERLIEQPEREARRLKAILAQRSSYRPLIEL